MIEEDTVFILGAGASCPYGFKDGKNLRKGIINKFEKDLSQYLQRVNDVRSRKNQYEVKAKDFIAKFRDSDNESIDLFLSRNRKFMDIGKWAIIFRILIYERNSKFREESIIYDQNWYSYLFKKLTYGCANKEDYNSIFDKRIYFITFNYDRSLEYYLHKCYFNSFSEIEDEEKKEQIKKLKVIHVFGKVSGLEWQDDEIKYNYRIDPFSVDVEEIAKDIKIIYEETEKKNKESSNAVDSNSEEKEESENSTNRRIKEAKDLIKNAKRIFFLGFGFAPENLKLLDIPNIFNRSQKINGTAYNLEEEEIKRIKKLTTPPTKPEELFPNKNIRIENCDCLKLLRKYINK